MNREILFRGKRKDNGEWVYGYYMKNNQATYICDTEHYHLNKSYKHYVVIPETVGQYTGLDDKNGKKIFEGDIIKCKLIDQIKEKGKWINKESYENYEVIYSEEYLGFRFKDEWRTVWQFNNCELEVIGTIFDENEDLLRKEVK